MDGLETESACEVFGHDDRRRYIQQMMSQRLKFCFVTYAVSLLYVACEDVFNKITYVCSPTCHPKGGAG